MIVTREGPLEGAGAAAPAPTCPCGAGFGLGAHARTTRQARRPATTARRIVKLPARFAAGPRGYLDSTERPPKRCSQVGITSTL